VRDPAQKRFFFPVRLRGFGVNDDGRFGVAAAEALDDPHTFDAHEIGVENAGAGQAVDDERFGLLNIVPVDDAVVFGAETGADRLGKVRVRGQNQNRFHGFGGRNWLEIFAIT
jgi:hypothetical protein